MSLSRIKELVEELNKAAKSYYQKDTEIMSNLEYDEKYDELLKLEGESGIVLATSPTQKVGYEILSELPKESHESAMLSLDKTKDVTALQEFLGEREGILSWKLDGLTIVLTYENGSLIKAVTRGNGIIGEVITNNARVFANLPCTIPYKGELILRGEAVIRYSDFRLINESIQEDDEKYKNPRNLCSGSVRQLNNEVAAKRNINFIGFSIVKADTLEFNNSRENQLVWLESQGFEVVEYKKVSQTTVVEMVDRFSNRVEHSDFPSDGLVLQLDDIKYGQSLGNTAKFPRDSIAFKWMDEKKETVLLEIEWSPSRTGLINPVAIFEPVELEGTTVSRASVHNISIIEELQLGIGDAITVYKANMIIPQIAENLSRGGNLEIPDSCPSCGKQTQIKKANDVKSLYCLNPNCSAKKIKSLGLFVSRDALNIDGFSEATLEKFVEAGYIKDFVDIFYLNQYRESITQMDGFGPKSYDNLENAIQRARITSLERVIYGLGIAGIGLANAKMLCKHFSYEYENMKTATKEMLLEVDGIGEVLAQGWVEFFSDSQNIDKIEALLNVLTIENTQVEQVEQIFEGKTFVVTGSLEQFANRKALQEVIEKKGGKVAGSVSSKTDYLINNDTSSNSSKNKKARELEIPILSEENFMELMGGN